MPFSTVNATRSSSSYPSSPIDNTPPLQKLWPSLRSTTTHLRPHAHTALHPRHARPAIQPRGAHLGQRVQPPSPHRRLRLLRPTQHPHHPRNIKVRRPSYPAPSLVFPLPLTRTATVAKPPTASNAPPKPPSPPPTTTSSPSSARTRPPRPPHAPPTTPPSPP